MDNQARYDCPTLGKVTIPEVYRKAWRIAAIYSNAAVGVTALVERICLIEKRDCVLAGTVQWWAYHVRPVFQ